MGSTAVTGEAVERLLQLGADADVVDEDGSPMLHRAVRIGNEDIVRLLLLYGANTGARDRTRITALLLARRLGRNAIADLLAPTL